MAAIKRNRFPAIFKTNTGLPLPAVTRSTDANVLRMSTNRFYLAAFTTASQRSKAGRSGGCRRIHSLTVRGFTTRTLPKWHQMPKHHEEKLIFGLLREAGGVGAVGVVLDRV